MYIFDNYSYEYKTRRIFELWIKSCYVYPMILKLLITRGNVTLIPKETTQEKENTLKIQPENLKKKEK